jgi:hypothetical protein
MVGRGGGDRNDKLLNKACALYALQPPLLANRNKQNKLSTATLLGELLLCNDDNSFQVFHFLLAFSFVFSKLGNLLSVRS